MIESYGERRDCADQRIPEFLLTCGYLPLGISNIPELVPMYFEEIKPDGILMTGGNSLVSMGGEAPEKDETDRKIISCALERHIPIYGFCRGMQSLLDYFGQELVEVSGHVATTHKLQGNLGSITVNSYHNQGSRFVNLPFEVLAYSEDGVVEAIQSAEYKIVATMWHPEREYPFKASDIERVKKLFQ